MNHREWTVRLLRFDRLADDRERRDVEVAAISEDEAIGKALRKTGLHDGWEVIGWWTR